MSEEGFNYLFFLIQWSVADTYHKVSLDGSSSHLDPKALCRTQLTSMHSHCSSTESASHPALLRFLSFQSGLYLSIEGIPSHELTHRISLIPKAL